VVGENPLATLPQGLRVKEALDRLELLIYIEKEGTFTNLEGRVQRIRQSMDPIGESLPDWHIMTAIASGLGQAMAYESAYDIQSEIMKLVPGYYNLGQPRKPAVNPDSYLSNGYTAAVANRYPSAVGRPSKEKPEQFGLTLGQILFHSGKMSTRASGLVNVSPNSKRLRMSPQDLERLGLNEGDRVRVASKQGTVEVAVQGDLSLLPGGCFFPEHFNDPGLLDLMPVEVDPTTGVPYFKFAEVSLEKI
jgi:formate dehydrogenase alpha subunit